MLIKVNNGVVKDIDVGGDVVDIVRSIDRHSYDTLPRLSVLERSTGRTMEELVELCLACGLSAKNIMGHVVNALYNEARKRDVYPSTMEFTVDPKEVLIELADVELCIEAVRHLAGITRNAVELEVLRKMSQLDRQAKAGEMVLIKGVMYRRVR